MKRNVDINQISDGKFYDSNDMVRVGCDGCHDCHTCCQGMGNTIVLDPVDIHMLTFNLKCTFEQLMADKIELNVVDGVILPNLKMNGSTEKCGFLNEEGRCSIHAFRPGICRLFPLGRIYENDSFKYFIQVYECPKENKTKVKVKNWLDIKDLKRYEEFIKNWHFLLKALEENVADADETVAKNISMYILNEFYIRSYDENNDIYGQIDDRIHKTCNLLGIKNKN